MTARTLDRQGRWRSKTIAFRISPEEDALLNCFVALSGMTKQDYIINRVLEREIIVNGNPKVYKALKTQLVAVLDELCRIEAGESVGADLLVVISQIATVMDGMKGGNTD